MDAGGVPPSCIERDDGPPAGFVFVQPGKRRGSEFLIPRLCVCYIAICLVCGGRAAFMVHQTE